MQWKQHPKYERFEVSDTGIIRNTSTGHVYKTRIFEGYETIGTHIKGKSLTFFVHRLVAQTYLENPTGLPQVNHIDGNKTYNVPCNLEWVSEKENIKHAFDTGLCGRLLTKDQIRFIKSVYKPRDRKYGRNALAATLGVSPDTIAYYYHGKNLT